MAASVNKDCIAAVRRKISKYSRQVTLFTSAVVKVYKAKTSANKWGDTGIVGAAVLLIDRYLKGVAIIRVYDLEVGDFFIGIRTCPKQAQQIYSNRVHHTTTTYESHQFTYFSFFFVFVFGFGFGCGCGFVGL